MPSASTTGQSDSEIGIGMPSLRSSSVSKWLTRSPAITRSEHRLHAVAQMLGEEGGQRRTEHLGLAVAEEPLRGLVPARHTAAGVVAEDGVVDRLEQRLEHRFRRHLPDVDRSRRRIADDPSHVLRSTSRR